MTKITNEELFVRDFLEPQKKSMRELIELTEKLQEEFRDLLKVQGEALKDADPKSVAGLKQRKEALSQINALNKEMQNNEKLRLKTGAELANIQSKEVKTLSKMRENKRILNKQNKEEAIQTSKLTTAYEKQNSKLRVLIRKYQGLAAAGKGNTTEAKNLLKQITVLDQRLKKIDTTVGRSQRHVGNYERAWRGLGGALRRTAAALGITAGLIGLARVVKSSIGIFVDFEQESANLASVLGKSRKEIRALSSDAKRLGASTKFTASEVTKLQTAFAKLGFKENEILNATEATLQLAAATGTDLDRAAEVAASTINGFGLEASETQRIVDVMAKSFSTSSLDMEKFATAMASVGATAKNAGVSVERTTALIGTITDAGIDASTAGTALRNIFLELSKQGLTFEDAMNQIRNATDKNKKAFELFGKRGATVAAVLADNVDKTKELEEGLNNAGGAAQKMADEQLSTLSGQMTILSSTWEGFILSLEDGNGVIARVLRGAIDLATRFLQVLTELSLSETQMQSKRIQDSKTETKEKTKQEVIQEQIVALQKESDETLQAIIDKGGQEAFIANGILNLRKKGATELQRQLIIASSMQEITERSVENSKKDNDVRILGINAQIKKLKLQKEENENSINTHKNTVNALELSEEDVKIKKLKNDRQKIFNELASKEGKIEALNEFQLAHIRKASEEELTKLTKLRGNFSERIVKLAEDELQRRKDISFEVSAVEDDEKKTKKHLDDQKKRLQAIVELEKERKRITDERVKVIANIESEQIAQQVRDLQDAIDKELERQLFIAETDPGAVNVDLLEKMIQDRFVIQKRAIEDERDFQIMEIEKSHEAFRDKILANTHLTESEKQNIIIENEKLTAEKIELIHEQSNNKLKELDKERINDIDDANDEIIEAQIDAAETANDLNLELLQKEKDVLKERLDAFREFSREWLRVQEERINKQIANIDREIEASRNRQEQFEQLAIQGVQTADQSITAEIKRQEELQAKRDSLEKKKARQKAIVDSLDLLADKIENNEADPVSSTIRDMTKLLAVISSLPGFYEGTKGKLKDEKIGRTFNTGKDDYVIRADGNEMIVNPGLTNKAERAGIKSTDELVDRAVLHSMGVMDDHIRYVEPMVREIHQPFLSPELLMQGFNRLENAINNLPVYEGMDFDQIQNMMNEHFRIGNSRKTKTTDLNNLFTIKKG